jgi:hypothetical protein
MSMEIRLELLRLTKPAVDNPDMAQWISRAAQLEAWIDATGAPSPEAQVGRIETAIPQARTPGIKPTRPKTGSSV